MASKQVRKITSITANELVKVDMADRDGDGKKIKDTYATQAALTTAANNADSGINANTAAISALGTRMTTAEGNISANATAISSEASTRATAVSNEATARANADTALSGRIDAVSSNLAAEVVDRKADVANLANIANGKTKTYVIGLIENNSLDEYNRIFNDNTTNYVRTYIDYLTNVSKLTVFHNVLCPFGTFSDDPNVNHLQNLAEYVVFVPAGVFDETQKSNLATATKSYFDLSDKPKIIELNIGDVILIKETDVPDRWFAGYDGPQSELVFAKLESTKVDLGPLTSDVTSLQTNVGTLQTTVGGHTTSITNLQTAVAGKQDALTYDSAPTANSNNSLTSGAVKTALDNLQSGLNLQSSVIGSVTIND